MILPVLAKLPHILTVIGKFEIKFTSAQNTFYFLYLSAYKGYVLQMNKNN